LGQDPRQVHERDDAGISAKGGHERNVAFGIVDGESPFQMFPRRRKLAEIRRRTTSVLALSVGAPPHHCHARIRGYCGHGFEAARAG
jgi:hypothetical protein